jgi:Predicted membrane protein
MMNYGRFGFGMMSVGLGWLMMLGITALVVLGIIALIRYIKNSNNNHIASGNSNALSILNERYAKGEISSEEYFRMKAEIQK